MAMSKPFPYSGQILGAQLASFCADLGYTRHIMAAYRPNALRIRASKPSLWRLSVIGLAFAALSVQAQGPASSVTQILNIGPRLQWAENGGYCGELNVQQCAMYYGTYASQFAVRDIVFHNQDVNHQVIVDRDTMGKAFDALKLTAAWFDTDNTPKPQYKSFCKWTKARLAQGYPTTFVTYDADGTDPDYDHILLAVGYSERSADQNPGPEDGLLYFQDHFSDDDYVREFSKLSDDRNMAGNGATHYYAIPKDVDYGCAVTGIRDSSRQALPVSITLDRINEPDLIAGKKPATLHAAIHMSGLESGKKYVVYRYNDYTKVPTKDYAKSAFSAASKFVATGPTRDMNDTFMSNAVVVYRCLPDAG
jgi:hypothetical protein